MGEKVLSGSVRWLAVLAACCLALALAFASPPEQASAGASGRDEAIVVDNADVLGPLDIRSSSLSQQGGDLVWRVSIGTRWSSRALAGEGRSLCIELARASSAQAEQRLCARRATRGPAHLYAEAQRLGVAGAVLSRSRSAASVDIIAPDTLQVRGAYAALGMEPGRIEWHVTSTWHDGAACAAACVDRAPDAGEAGARLRRERVAGCVVAGASLRRSGSSAMRQVALTFDDGPSPMTPRFLRALHGAGVHATFFVLGSQVARRPATLRATVAAGHAVGNHSYSHPVMERDTPLLRSQLGSTSRLIRRWGRYDTCLYRPPYGLEQAASVARARRMGMETVTWDVDPQDWDHISSSQVRDRVLTHVHPGAIILLHDGGGDRSATLAALPAIIASLKQQHYRMVTVPELLGLRPTWRYGSR